MRLSTRIISSRVTQSQSCAVPDGALAPSLARIIRLRPSSRRSDFSRVLREMLCAAFRQHTCWRPWMCASCNVDKGCVHLSSLVLLLCRAAHLGVRAHPTPPVPGTNQAVAQRVKTSSAAPDEVDSGRQTQHNDCQAHQQRLDEFHSGASRTSLRSLAQRNSFESREGGNERGPLKCGYFHAGDA